MQGSILSLLTAVDRAALGLYKPKGYTEEEMLRGYLLLKVGGAKVATIANRAFRTSPSVSTLRAFHVVDPLVASPQSPIYQDILSNIKTSFPTDGPFAFSPELVALVGLIWMIDEVKCEELLRYDAATNMILGICREHSSHLSLEFNSLADLEKIYDALEKGEVHRAKEVRCFYREPKSATLLTHCNPFRC
jgi:hypothetical protein